MSILGKFRKDSALAVSGTVKSAAGTNYSGVVDLGAVDSQGLRNEDFEFLVTFPACTTTHFPTNTSLKLVLQSSESSTFASGVVDWRSASVTGGTAYNGETFRFKPPEDAARYWRIAATTALTSTGATGTGAGDLVYSIDYLA